METSPVKPSRSPARTLSGTARPARAALDRNDWIEAAIDVLATSGIGGLRVEVLAKTCDVTKGSFYWHFKNRQDLLEAVLDYWRQGRLRDIEKTTALGKGAPRDQLHYLIDIYGANRNRKGMAIELAVRDWARHDPLAASVVEAVDIYRLECTRRLFVGAGLSDAEAKSRSVLLYASVFGLSLMHYDRFDENLASLKKRIAGHIVGL